MSLRSLRQGLLFRLLAGSALIAVCSVTATAWIAARTTSGTIYREQEQQLATESTIYDALIGYGAMHRDWTGVQAQVDQLVSATGRRIVVTTANRGRLAESPAGSVPVLPGRAAAVLDALTLEPSSVPEGSSSTIDPRAVGPFLLPEADRNRLAMLAGQAASCLAASGTVTEIRVAPNGRSWLSGPEADPVQLLTCASAELNRTTSTEDAALRDLDGLVNACLRAQGLGPAQVWIAPSGRFGTNAPGLDTSTVSDCLENGRRQQLRSFVAPPALLFVGDPVSRRPQDHGLLTAGTVPLVGAALLVLVLTVGTSFLLSSRLVRPIRALTTAARRMRDGERGSRMTVKTTGEVATLAAAFNDMSAHLERTEEQRKELMSDVSHELRTPLTNIRGYLESAQDGVLRLDPELVASLLEETMLLQHLVEDLQVLALAEAGELRLYPEPTAVVDVLDQVAAAHRVRADAAGVTLSTRVDGDPGVTADPVRLRQAVGNLVSNAVRHTPPGGLVRLTGRDVAGEVIIEVADTGAGIAKDDLPRVFDRFWRGDKSRTRRSGGSGLGLAIVRNLIQSHGGRVEVSSTVGVGTTFAIQLPADVAG